MEERECHRILTLFPVFLITKNGNRDDRFLVFIIEQTKINTRNRSSRLPFLVMRKTGKRVNIRWHFLFPVFLITKNGNRDDRFLEFILVCSTWTITTTSVS